MQATSTNLSPKILNKIVGSTSPSSCPPGPSVITRNKQSFRASSKLDLSRLCNPSEAKEARPPSSFRGMDASTPSLSFIGIIDTTPDAKWVYVSASVSDLLGFEPHELIGRSSYDLSHPDEIESVIQHHLTIAREKKAAVLVYLRLRHKDPHKGYITCASTCTVAGSYLIGGISAATSGSKAMHNASTAQEVIVISPSATLFDFRLIRDTIQRWNDPTPTSSVPVSPISISTPPLSASAITSPSSASSPTSTRLRSTSDVRPSTPALRSQLSLERSLSRPPSPSEARTALILDRFSIECTVLYTTDDVMFSTETVIGRSFFDFVARPDEMRIRTAMETIKGWGVNERGHPSDGGFGFNKFRIIPGGRDSSGDRQAEGSPTQQRQPIPTMMSSQSQHPYNRDRRPLSLRSPTAPVPLAQGSPSRRPRLQIRAVSDQVSGVGSRDRTPISPTSEEMTVDAIFSPQSDGIIVILRPALNPN